MKKILTFLFLLLCSAGCNAENINDNFANNNMGNSLDFEGGMFYLMVDNQEIACEFASSVAAKELKEILKNGAITINMKNYGGFEKVGSLPQNLTKNDESINASSGDILLYQGRYMVIMYGSNLWSYTRLGKITGLSSSEIYNILSKAGNSMKVYIK